MLSSNQAAREALAEIVFWDEYEAKLDADLKGQARERLGLPATDGHPLGVDQDTEDAWP